MTTDYLEDLIRRLDEEESVVSEERREMHGIIDTYRIEMLRRTNNQDAPTSDAELAAETQRAMSRIGPPPISSELEAFGQAETTPDSAPPGRPTPDSINDEELAGIILRLADEERTISMRRNELHERIDKTRALLAAQRQHDLGIDL
jgi:hypothetical protein